MDFGNLMLKLDKLCVEKCTEWDFREIKVYSAVDGLRFYNKRNELVFTLNVNDYEI